MREERDFSGGSGRNLAEGEEEDRWNGKYGEEETRTSRGRRPKGREDLPVRKEKRV